MSYFEALRVPLGDLLDLLTVRGVRLGVLRLRGADGDNSDFWALMERS